MKTPLTLGHLIAALSKAKPTSSLRYDFGPYYPDGLESYRGYYDHLALGFSEEPATVGVILELCKNMVGHTRTGYKGGDYLMTSDTPIWVANWGRCHSTALVNVIDEDWKVILETGYVSN